MSISQIVVLMRDQHDMLKTYIPAFKIFRSGSVEEQEAFSENLFSEWFTLWPEGSVHYPDNNLPSALQQALIDKAIQCHRRKGGIYSLHTKEVNVEGILSCQEVMEGIDNGAVWRGTGTPHMKNLQSPLVQVHPDSAVTPHPICESALCQAKNGPLRSRRNFSLVSCQNCEHAASKQYGDFYDRVSAQWFVRWPEHEEGHDLSPDEVKALAEVIKMRRGQIITWYQWQKNPVCLGCSKGSRGTLKFNMVLAGGVELKGTCTPQKMDIYSHEFYTEKVKHAADKAIKQDNITNKGPMLNKHCEITWQMYQEESEAVKAKNDKKYCKAKAKFTSKRQHLKSAKGPKINENTKLKAIQELGPVLDHVLKYLGHMTCGWKFTVLMGGRDPMTGEVSVFNKAITLVNLKTVHNSITYISKDFDAMQGAFLMFVKNALMFESTLPKELENDESGDEESSSDSDNDKDSPFENMYCMTPKVDLLTTADASACDPASTDASAGIPASTDASSGPPPLVEVPYISANASAYLGSTSKPNYNLPLANEWPYDPTLDMITMGTADFGAFNPNTFSAIVADPIFDPTSFNAAGRAILNLISSQGGGLNNINDSPAPMNDEEGEVAAGLEVFLPAVPLTVNNRDREVNIDSEDSTAGQPEICPRCGMRRQNDDQSPAPVMLPDPPAVPHLHVHNHVPFNP
ncbi:hypothetical protein BDR05DRAFT_946689 [Suillus weaverae]|nr:hypothetical protein BDR05DRAFT_946689 [Suillus weaverae]